MRLTCLIKVFATAVSFWATQGVAQEDRCKIDLNEPNYIAKIPVVMYQSEVLPAIRRMVLSHSAGASYKISFADFWIASGLHALTQNFPFQCCSKCPVSDCGSTFGMSKKGTARADFSWSSGSGQSEPFSGSVAGNELIVEGELPSQMSGSALVSADAVKFVFSGHDRPIVKATDINFEGTGNSVVTVDYPILCFSSSSQYAYLVPIEKSGGIPNLPLVILPE